MATRTNDVITCTRKTKTHQGAKNGRTVAMATTIATATALVVIRSLRHLRLQFRVIKLHRRMLTCFIASLMLDSTILMGDKQFSRNN